ncbi:hypothetical protein [uncultured Ruminococcus sp.]|uniref:hypothetical protein n=1 Tax=uncultured Ruminococcus sp. TaxID=165186 RepID=UPI00260541DB|nr:hypothetical protein [uncultured Ruminococcus sp.]
MENRRVIAIFIAMLAAFLVILAGRSCAMNIDNTNKKSNKSKAVTNNRLTSDTSASEITAGKTTGNNPGNTFTFGNTTQTDTAEDGTDETAGDGTDSETTKLTDAAGVEYVTDILGRVVETIPAQETDTTEPTTHVEKQYVTDILGRVVEENETVISETEPAGDPHIEYVTDILGRVVSTKYVDENGQEVTTQAASGKNPLEEYREKYSEYYPTTDDPGDDPVRPSSTIHIKIG